MVIAGEWGRRFGLEKVGYGNPKDDDRAELPDAGVRHLSSTDLACSPKPEKCFTQEGRLERCESELR